MTSAAEERDFEVVRQQAKALAATRQFHDAVAMYSQACQMAQQVHQNDVFALPMASLWYEYGRALFEVAVLEGALLNNPVSTAEQGDVEEDDGDSDFQTDDGEDEQQQEMDDQEEQDQPEQEGQLQMSNSTDDFETAWEALEMARVIYQLHLPPDTIPFIQNLPSSHASQDQGIERHFVPADKIAETKMQLAEVHLLLADLSLEQEMYEQAAEDLLTALALKKSILKHCHQPEQKAKFWDLPRHLAEIYFKHAMVYEYDAKFLPAIQQLETAIALFRALIDALQSSPSASDASSDSKGKRKAAASSSPVIDLNSFFDQTDIHWSQLIGQLPKEERDTALSEMTELLPELNAKLQDFKDQLEAQALKETVSSSHTDKEQEDGAMTTIGFGMGAGSSGSAVNALGAFGSGAAFDLSSFIKKPVASANALVSPQKAAVPTNDLTGLIKKRKLDQMAPVADPETAGTDKKVKAEQHETA